MIIYQITNQSTGMQYIGQTILPLKERWRLHCNSGGCPKLTEAIVQYGRQDFIVKPLLIAESLEELNYYEEALIAKFKTLTPNGYNVLAGGNSGATLEVRQQISNALKGRSFSAEHRANLSKAMTGKKNPPITDEHREKLKQASKKMWETRDRVFPSHTPEAIEKIRVASTGRQHSDETKAKISATRIRKQIRHTPEVLARISEKRKGQMSGEHHPMFGKTHSEEARQKISEASKGRNHTKDAKQKISIASKKTWETRERTVPYKPRPSMQGRTPWNKGKTGFTHTDEVKQKISEASKLSWNIRRQEEITT